VDTRPHGQLTDQRLGLTGNWSPIETAPKNAPVLVFDGPAMSIAERFMGRWYALVGDEPVWWEDRSMAIVEPTCWMLEPTCWMPLPNPPGAFDPH
jgi:hypothetical protein